MDFSGIDKLLLFLFWTAGISIVFTIWKIIEILIWLYNHVSINIM